MYPFRRSPLISFVTFFIATALMMTPLSTTFSQERTDNKPSTPEKSRAEGAQKEETAEEMAEDEARRNDPCEHLLELRGKAKGLDKKCPSLPTSSNGIVKADFNGDGFADLAIGVPNQTVNGVANAGAVNVIYGSSNGLTTSTTAGVPQPQTWTAANTGVSAPGIGTNANFGIAVAAGDFNADGKSDLAIIIRKDVIPAGASLTGERLANVSDLVVLYGSANGLTGPVQFFGEVCGEDNFAQGLTWGDFNGDGAGDLLVGCAHHDFFGGLTLPVFVLYYGQKNVGLSQFNALNVALWGLPADLKYSTEGVVLTAGDFNGDGRTDVAVGLPGMDLVDASSVFCSVSGCPILKSEIGAVAVLYGSSSIFNFGSSQQLFKQGDNGICCSPSANAHFGQSLAAGDFNGDGRQDLAIGLPGGSVGGLAGAGAVVIINGSSGLLTSNGTQIWNENSVSAAQIDNAFGSALAANDFNGDGYADLAVGIPNENLSGTTNAGQVDVIYGSSSGLSTTSHLAQIWHQGNGVGGSPTPGGHYGRSLSAWNFGRNQITGTLGTIFLHSTADLAIGAPNATVSGVVNAGEVNVLYGDFFAGGLTANGNQLFTQASLGLPLSGDRFGFTMY